MSGSVCRGEGRPSRVSSMVVIALLLLVAATTGGVSATSPIAQGNAAMLFVTASQSSALQSQNTGETHFEGRMAAIEQRTGARIGVAALNSSSGKRLGYRLEERFPMCSTFKFLAAAAVLKPADEKKDRLGRFIRYEANDILDYAPVTKEHLIDGGMTLGALCEAAIEQSDNTAGNLLLDTIGGPVGLTNFARSIGDETTRLDRKEPDLN